MQGSITLRKVRKTYVEIALDIREFVEAIDGQVNLIDIGKVISKDIIPYLTLAKQIRKKYKLDMDYWVVSGKYLMKDEVAKAMLLRIASNLEERRPLWQGFRRLNRRPINKDKLELIRATAGFYGKQQ